jgi:hypothetical protein
VAVETTGFVDFCSKPTMNINSQRHNLLRNQISPKSEDFCILWPFCTLVTLATAAILNFWLYQALNMNKNNEKNPLRKF